MSVYLEVLNSDYEISEESLFGEGSFFSNIGKFIRKMIQVIVDKIGIVISMFTRKSKNQPTPASIPENKPKPLPVSATSTESPKESPINKTQPSQDKPKTQKNELGLTHKELEICMTYLCDRTEIAMFSLSLYNEYSAKLQKEKHLTINRHNQIIEDLDERLRNIRNKFNHRDPLASLGKQTFDLCMSQIRKRLGSGDWSGLTDDNKPPQRLTLCIKHLQQIRIQLRALEKLITPLINEEEASRKKVRRNDALKKLLSEVSSTLKTVNGILASLGVRED